MDAIITEDKNALEAMMCKNIKQYVPDLHGEIQKLFDAVDGEVIDYALQFGGPISVERRSDGRQISQRAISVNFSTSEGNYVLAVNWEIVCNFAPEETGIRYIILYSGSLSDPDKVKLAEIMATEGWGGWHD